MNNAESPGSALAILTVRNEGAFLLEWLAHHRAVGFTDFLVFSNNCQDGTDAILDRLQDMGWLTHVRNEGPYDKGGIQFTALKTATKLEVFEKADWVMPLDIDEFVNIHAGDGTLKALLDALPAATAITLTWRLFGNSGEVRHVDQPITDTFTKAAPEVIHWPWRAAMFKTLYKNDGTYGKLGVHRPRNPNPDRVQTAHWFDGHGRTLDAQYKTRRIFSPYGRPNFGLAQLNHYPLGSMEDYVLKADRGRAVHASDTLGLDYWIERNFNTDLDTSVARYKPARDAWTAEMMQDEALHNLRGWAVKWRRKRFDELMKLDPYRALFGRLLMAPPSRPVTQKAAQFLIQHATASGAGQ